VIRYVARRLGWALVVVWATTTVTFLISNVLPGDPARMIAGPQARPADVERMRGQLGLDRPLVVRYGVFLKKLVHLGPLSFEPRTEKAHATCAVVLPLYPAHARGTDLRDQRTPGLALHLDFGRSFRFQQPVVAVLAERLPRTAVLALAAIVLQVVFGVATGIFAATRRNTLGDHAAVGLTLLGISVPTFILALVLQFVLAYKLRVLPLDGFGSTFGEHVSSMVLPALTLGIYGAAFYARLVRDEMIGLLKQDFVRTARAKGAGDWAVVVRHAFRNALAPLVTVIGLDLGALLGGAIVTEQIFRWPGLGQLAVGALLNRDTPVIAGTVIVTSAAIVLCNLLVDLSYTVLDPRVRR
jgi:peptide/nickel transport system permease protein